MSIETAQLCRCCNQPAAWLITGYSPEGRYESEPVCDVAKAYISECAAECHCEFSAVRITPANTGGKLSTRQQRKPIGGTTNGWLRKTLYCTIPRRAQK